MNKTLVMIIAGLILNLLFVCSGCASTEGKAVLHPGVDKLVKEGMPVDGTGLPPGVKLPKKPPLEKTSEDPMILEKYREFVR